MVEIVPAVLEETLEEITARLSRIKGAAPAVQIDVADGILVPNKTWPYVGRDERREFERIASEEEGLPLWEDFNFEIDLMLSTVGESAAHWVSAGASRLVIHALSADALTAARNLQVSRGDSLGIQVGIALSSNGSPEQLKPFDGLYDFVQVMGIARVGFQGEPFDAHALTLISQLRALEPELPIQVDGGVRLQNVRGLAEAGATRLITGSAIFGSDNPREMIERLTQEANK